MHAHSLHTAHHQVIGTFYFGYIIGQIGVLLAQFRQTDVNHDDDVRRASNFARKAKFPVPEQGARYRLGCWCSPNTVT